MHFCNKKGNIKERKENREIYWEKYILNKNKNKYFLTFFWIFLYFYFLFNEHDVAF